MKHKFYGIAGVNAYGVYNDYDKVLNAKTYIAKFKNKKFDTFDEAKTWAEEMYYSLQTPCILFNYRIDDIEKINWTYYRKKK